MIRAGKLAVAIVFSTATLNGTNVYAGPISYTGTPYTENFEALPFLRSGNIIAPWVDDSILPGWYASGAQYLRSGSGASLAQVDTSVFTYSSNSFDKAFGSQVGTPYANDAVIRFGMRILNDTGMPLSRFTLSYFGEQWRDGGNDQIEQLSFDYAIDAQSLTAGNYIAVSDLNFRSPNHGVYFSILDGNLPANRIAVAATIADINWAPGESLWLRWTDINEPGYGYNSALAIDDLVFTADVASPPADAVSSAVLTPQPPLSISEPSTGWLAGLCVAALAVITRRPTKRRATTAAPQRRLTK